MIQMNAQKIRSMNGLIFYTLSIFFISCADELAFDQKKDQLINGSTQEIQKIINGKEEYDYSGVVALSYDGQLLCTGTLIAPTTVLTAAHCLQSYGSQFRVIPIDKVQAGNQYHLDSTQQSNVVDFVLHEKWTGVVGSDYPYDLAMLYLDQPIDGVDFYDLIDQNSSKYLGKDLKAIGFGRTDASDYFSVGKKMSTDLRLMTNNRGILRSESTQSYSGICFGDSGGPLLMIDTDGKPRILGVASYVKNNCSQSSYHIDVSMHLDWIISNLISPLVGTRGILNNQTCQTLTQICNFCGQNTSCHSECQILGSSDAQTDYVDLLICGNQAGCIPFDFNCMQNACVDQWQQCTVIE